MAKYENEFILTNRLMKSLKSRGYSLVCGRQRCGKNLKVGDKIVSTGGSGLTRKHFHKQCRELQRTPQPSKKLKFIILDEGELTKNSMRNLERVIKVALQRGK